jgi:integral membrane protein
MQKIPLKTTLGQFRWIALLEGISFIVLLFVAMPLKYLFNMPKAVSMVGMAHGVLFVAYIIFLYMVWQEQKWSFGKAVLGFVVSLIPFGTFWFDKKYCR